MVTVLREEEIGIPACQIDIIAQLELASNNSGFLVTLFLGFLIPPYQWQPDSNGVATIFEIPLEYLMEPQNYYTKEIAINNIVRQVYFMRFKEKIIEKQGYYLI